MQGPHSHRVCIIDDDDAVCDSFSELLRSHGFSVRDFGSALDFLADRTDRGQDCDCVVADLHMPGMSGLELLELLQTRHANLPFVMITGRSDSVLKDRARRAGVVAMLDKPVDEDALLDAIERAIASQISRRIPLSLKTIRLELARSKDHPAGDVGHGYTFRAPLDSGGHLDSHGWHNFHDLCVVHHFEGGQEVEGGLLKHTRSGRWVFSYAPGEDDDEALFRFSKHAFVPGEYVSVTEHDGVERTFRVASVTDWHPQSASSLNTNPDRRIR